MVLKLMHFLPLLMFLFENDVEMYGAQTVVYRRNGGKMFENDVEMYGAQTKEFLKLFIVQFENDVEMYGAQTHQH